MARTEKPCSSCRLTLKGKVSNSKTFPNSAIFVRHKKTRALLSRVAAGNDGTFQCELWSGMFSGANPLAHVEFELICGGFVVPATAKATGTKAKDGTISFKLIPKDTRAQMGSHRPLEIQSYSELKRHEPEILERISSLPNGGSLFAAHALRCLEEAGVILAPNVRKKLVDDFPNLTLGSERAFQMIRATSCQQRVHIRVASLFGRRS